MDRKMISASKENLVWLLRNYMVPLAGMPDECPPTVRALLNEAADCIEGKLYPDIHRKIPDILFRRSIR